MIRAALVNELSFVDTLDYVRGLYLGRRYSCEHVDGGGTSRDGCTLVYFTAAK
jgi:hypothetical protein